MIDEKSVTLATSDLYAMFWQLVHLQVHRYGSRPTGELLIMLTIALLDSVDYHPTVTKLSEITNLPKSSVSRYLATEIRMGFVEEIIDPNDRRRRLLHVTEKVREEGQWHWARVREILRLKREASEEVTKSGDPGAELEAILRGFSRTQLSL